MKKRSQTAFIFICIILSGGIIMGWIGSNFIELSQLNQLDGILLPLNDSYDLYSTFMFQFSLQLFFILSIVILGTSVFGTFLISFLLFTKGFQIGLTCMMFIYTYELKGILGIIFTLLPQVVLEMLPILIMALFSIESSNHILFSCINSSKLKVSYELNKGLNYLILSIIFALITNFLKVSIIIRLIRLFNQI
ncbi:MAG: stage II sporulation protein M [Traorella sp.]